MEECFHWKFLESHYVWQQDIKFSHVRPWPSSAESNTQRQNQAQNTPKSSIQTLPPVQSCCRATQFPSQQHLDIAPSKTQPEVRTGTAHSLQEQGESTFPPPQNTPSLQCHFHLIFARHSQSKDRFSTSSPKRKQQLPGASLCGAHGWLQECPYLAGRTWMCQGMNSPSSSSTDSSCQAASLSHTL